VSVSGVHSLSCPLVTPSSSHRKCEMGSLAFFYLVRLLISDFEPPDPGLFTLSTCPLGLPVLLSNPDAQHSSRCSRTIPSLAPDLHPSAWCPHTRQFSTVPCPRVINSVLTEPPINTTKPSVTPPKKKSPHANVQNIRTRTSSSSTFS